MPTYNQAEFLPAALDSIEAQTFGNFELIVCDDGSTDRTSTILELHPCPSIIKTHDHNRGTAAAINSAAERASGELMTWVSSDNTMELCWLETLMVGMADDVGAVYSGYWREAPGQRHEAIFQPYHPGLLVSNENCYIGPSFLIRAEVWRAAGPHTGGISHDYGHWLRIEEECWRRDLRIVGIPEPLCHYRIHDGRATVTLKHLYDADGRRREALERRKQCVLLS